MSRALLLVAALASVPLMAADEERFLIRVMNVDRELAKVELEGGFTETRLHLRGIAQPLEIVRTSPREARALLPVRLPPGAYMLWVSNVAKPSLLPDIPIEVGPVGPVVQEN
jgi:hypothetical protein